MRCPGRSRTNLSGSVPTTGRKKVSGYGLTEPNGTSPAGIEASLTTLVQNKTAVVPGKVVTSGMTSPAPGRDTSSVSAKEDLKEGNGQFAQVAKAKEEAKAREAAR